MKSGLEDRNNRVVVTSPRRAAKCLNEVRPGRPEQLRRTVKYQKELEKSQ